MLDIEYISEISIASLYGLQNKKSRLDYYYGAFESEFPDREKVEDISVTILTQLEALMRWPTKLRWSRKVDFYTMFVAFSRRTREMPFDREESARVTERLRLLSESVSEILSLGEEDLETSDRAPAAVIYARGVRNSSDLGSRRLRDRGLRTFVWGEEFNTESLMHGPENEHLARLPNPAELLRADEVDEDEGE